MLSTNGFRRSTVGVTLAVGVALAMPGAAGADQDTGSGGTNDAGSSTGSAVFDLGSSIAVGALDFGSSILGLPPLSGFSSGPGGPAQPCNASTKAGHDGVTDTVHLIGRGGPTSFLLSYETYSVPDLIEVFYQGGLVATTGWVGDATNEGTGSIVVNLPPGGDTSVLVRVHGGAQTDWEYVVHCP